MWPDKKICDLFSVDIPVIQAPMGGASGLEMALAVNDAGGLGSLACAPLNALQLRETLKAASRHTKAPLNVNFFAHAQPIPDDVRDQNWLKRLSGYADEKRIQLPTSLASPTIVPFDSERCEVVEEYKPSIISFHFGLPEPKLVLRIKSFGAKIISSATTVTEARWLEDQGCDAIIAQGYEAGGHRAMFLTEDISTQIGTFSLVPQVVDNVSVPVIAAGGVADGRGIAAALTLGASAVQIGTAYLLTKESEINTLYRSTLKGAIDHETSMTNVISGRPTRVFVNRVVKELGPMAQHAPEFPKGFAALSALRTASEQSQERDFSAHFAGQSASLARCTTSFQLTRDLASETLRRLAHRDD